MYSVVMFAEKAITQSDPVGHHIEGKKLLPRFVWDMYSKAYSVTRGHMGDHDCEEPCRFHQPSDQWKILW